MKCPNPDCGHKLRVKVSGTPQKPIVKVLGHNNGFRKGICGVQDSSITSKHCTCTKYPPLPIEKRTMKEEGGGVNSP